MLVEGINFLKNNTKLYLNYSNNLDSNRGSMPVVNLLKKTSNRDVVNFKGNSELTSYDEIQNLRHMTEYSHQKVLTGNYTMDMKDSGDNFQLKVTNKLTGREVSGEIFDKDVILYIKSKSTDLYNGSITGEIDCKNVNLKYKESDDRKGIEIIGDIPSDYKQVLSLLVYDYAKQRQMAMTR